MNTYNKWIPWATFSNVVGFASYEFHPAGKLGNSANKSTVLRNAGDRVEFDSISKVISPSFFRMDTLNGGVSLA
jgi:hypothetical protein